MPKSKEEKKKQDMLFFSNTLTLSGIYIHMHNILYLPHHGLLYDIYMYMYMYVVQTSPHLGPWLAMHDEPCGTTIVPLALQT